MCRGRLFHQGLEPLRNSLDVTFFTRLPVPEASDQTQHCQLSPVYTSKADVLAPLAVVPDFSRIIENVIKMPNKSYKL